MVKVSIVCLSCLTGWEACRSQDRNLALFVVVWGSVGPLPPANIFQALLPLLVCLEFGLGYNYALAVKLDYRPRRQRGTRQSIAIIFDQVTGSTFQLHRG